MNPKFIFIAGGKLEDGTWVTAYGHTREGAQMKLREQYAFCHLIDHETTKYKTTEEPHGPATD